MLSRLLKLVEVAPGKCHLIPTRDFYEALASRADTQYVGDVIGLGRLFCKINAHAIQYEEEFRVPAGLKT